MVIFRRLVKVRTYDIILIMNEQFSQERNLSLERQELNKKIDTNFDRQKELQKDADIIEKDGKKFYRFKSGSEQHEEYKNIVEDNKKTLETVVNISEYKNLASPIFEDKIIPVKELNTRAELEQAQIENKQEIQKVQESIENTKSKLNELRGKLGMPPSEDIPSLLDKKAKLESLMIIHNDLELKIKDQEARNDSNLSENKEEANLEKYNIKSSIEEISNSLSSIRSELNDRDGAGLNQVFENDDAIRRALSDFNSFNDISELPEFLNRLSSSLNIEYRGRGRFSENSDSLRDLAHKLGQLHSVVEVIPLKIRSNEVRNKIGDIVGRLKNSIDEARMQILAKASQIEGM